MGFVSEFKEFALKGNLVDLAVAFVMGAAFNKVTSAFIDGMVMPIVGMIQGKDFSEWKFTLKEATTDESGKVIEAVAVKYGAFITVVVEFLIVAFVMFVVIKAINTAKRKEEAAPAAAPAPTKEEILLTEIRDALKAGR